MRYNSTLNPFTKYLKERMKTKKKKKRAEKEMGLLSCPRRERERSEGQRGESTATELADLTPAREEGSDRGRVGFNFQTLNLP